ncbi:unnamed protein product, partial [marine sediment metagenome]
IVAGEYEPFDPKKIQVEIVPEEWNKIAGTYGSPGRLQKIRVKGYMICDTRHSSSMPQNDVTVVHEPVPC